MISQTGITFFHPNGTILMFYLIIILLSATLAPHSLEAQAKDLPVQSEGGFLTIRDKPLYGLEPRLLFIREGSNDWEVCVEFVPLTNFQRHSWLLTANHFQSKLRLWSTNGMELKPTDEKVSEAMNLPAFTTVSNALHGIRWERRGGQWPYGKTGQNFQTAGFSLRSAFDVPFTNDILLQVTPLLYKEDINNQTVSLVEFVPVRVRLKVDGSAEKLE